MDSKTCKSCGAEKSLDQFRLMRRMKDGRLNQCRSCEAEATERRRRLSPSDREAIADFRTAAQADRRARRAVDPG